MERQEPRRLCTGLGRSSSHEGSRYLSSTAVLRLRLHKPCAEVTTTDQGTNFKLHVIAFCFHLPVVDSWRSSLRPERAVHEVLVVPCREVAHAHGLTPLEGLAPLAVDMLHAFERGQQPGLGSTLELGLPGRVSSFKGIGPSFAAGTCSKNTGSEARQPEFPSMVWRSCDGLENPLHICHRTLREELPPQISGYLDRKFIENGPPNQIRHLQGWKTPAKVRRCWP